MARPFKFWTKQEDVKLLQLIKTSKNANVAAKEFSKTSERPFPGVQFRAVKFRRELGISKKVVIKTDKLNTSTERGVDLPNGFVFNFTPKKAEMFENHVRLYF